MSRRATLEPSPFTPQERDLIRRELCQHFGQNPRAADGFLLRTWRSGPQAGQPKLPLAVQSMLERGLVEIRMGRGPRAVFTPGGLAALRRLLSDRRAMDPARLARQAGYPAELPPVLLPLNWAARPSDGRIAVERSRV
jgi:hypothetical protein